MAVPLTVKQYLIRQKLADLLEGANADQLLTDILEGLGLEFPDVGDAEHASWTDALARTRKRLLS